MAAIYYMASSSQVISCKQQEFQSDSFRIASSALRRALLKPLLCLNAVSSTLVMKAETICNYKAFRPLLINPLYCRGGPNLELITAP